MAGIVPKPLSKQETELVDTVRILAGERICPRCKGQGWHDATWERQVSKGFIVHAARGKCFMCHGARLIKEGISDDIGTANAETKGGLINGDD
jgi:hypothetical protein